MIKGKNFFDLALMVVFPELTAMRKAIGVSKVLTKAQKASQLSALRNIKKSLPTLKGSTAQITKAKTQLAKVMEAPIDQAYIKFLSNPKKFADQLGTMTTAERKELGESIADATGDIETSPLSSSWLIYGVYEPASTSTGALTITTKDGGSYTYPGVPIGTWEQMKAATGKNGSGAGTVFWIYLRGYNITAASKKIALAFQLSG